MRVTELFFGFGLGGAEVAAIARLKYAPAEVRTTFVVAQGDPGAGPLALPVGLTGQVEVCGPGIGEQASAIRESLPDVLVINTPRQAMQVLLARKRTIECPIVVAAHSEILSDRLACHRPLSLGMRLANPRASLHIAVSVRAASGPWCRGARRVEVCHLGSELSTSDTISAATWPPNCSLRLLTLSRLTQPKNLLALLDAMSRCAHQLRSAAAHLRIVGDGPERARLAQAATAAGIDDLVSFAGLTDAPAAWLEAADWLFIPSLAEGGPLTVYEGVQSGVRIMGTARGAIPEVLAQDPASILLEQTDVTAIVCGLARVLSAPARLPGSERKKRKIMGSAWSTKDLAPSWYQALESVA